MQKSSEQTQRENARFMNEYRQLLQTWQQQQTDYDHRLVQMVNYLQALHAQMQMQSCICLLRL